MRSTLFPLAATTAVQLLASMALVTVPVFAPVAARDVGLSAALLSLFVSVSYCTSMVASLFAGALVRRGGAIRVSQLSLGLCALGMVSVAAGSPGLVFAGAVLVGIGYAPITPASSHILARTTPASMMSFVFSLKQTGVPLGGAAAGALVPVLVLWGGWRFAALAVGLACLAVALLTQPLRRELDDDREPGRRLATGGLLAVLRTTLRDPMLRRLALCSFCFAGLQLSLVSFLVTYLTASIAYTLVAAGLMLTVAQVGGTVGRIAFGAIADRTRRPMRVLGGVGAGMALCAFVTAFFSPGTPSAWVATVCAVFGATAIGWNGVFLAQVARFAPAGEASAATAGALFFTYAGVVVFPTLFALLVESGAGYAVAFLVCAIPAAACALWLLARNLDAVP